MLKAKGNHTMKSQAKQDLINAAMNVVFENENDLVIAQMSEHCIANCGLTLADFIWASESYKTPRDLRRLFVGCYQTFYGQSESDEMAAGTDEEYRSWRKDALRDLARVKKAGLPLTLQNTRDAFENKGVFAKKK